MWKSILQTATFRQSQITIVGTVVNGVLGALFYVFLARWLGPADFGLLVVSITTLTLLADMADLGTNTGLVRFVSSNAVKNYDQALKFLKLSLEIKLLVWLTVLVVGFFLSPFLASEIFKKTELVLPLRLSMVGVGGALLFSYVTSSLQSFQRFFAWSVINVATNLLRLGLILMLAFYQTLNLTTGLISYIALPFLGFFLGLALLPTRAMLASSLEFSVSKQFFQYNVWVALFTVMAAISSRLDTFLNARLLSSYEVGIYGAANQLVQVVPQLVGALGVVAAPKFASFQSTKVMLTYFKKFQTLVLGLSLLGTLAIPVSFYVIPFVYGKDYAFAVLPFIILLLAMLTFLISVPIHSSIIFYFGKPQVFVWVAIGHLSIISILGYFMISNYGVVGAAITVLIGMLFNFFAPLIWFLSKVHSQCHRERTE